jgi:hypothetical protein
MSSSQSEARLSQIPEHLRIRVLHDTDDFAIIFKPCNLRSVPGHASPPPSRKRPRSEEGQRRTGQEAWVLAIRSFRDDTPSFDDDKTMSALQCLHRLANSEKKLVESIPRKHKLFRRYVERNRKTLIQSRDDPIDVDSLSNEMFNLIQERQKPLMNLPEPTKDEDSAFGQLLLMGYGGIIDNQSGKADDPISEKLLVVHRLDCEVGTKPEGSKIIILSNSVLIYTTSFLVRISDLWNHGICQKSSRRILLVKSLEGA